MLLSCRSSLYFLDINLLMKYGLQILCPILELAFSPCWLYAWMPQNFKFWCSLIYLFIFVFLFCIFHIISKKSLSKPMSWTLPSAFFSKSFSHLLQSYPVHILYCVYLHTVSIYMYCISYLKFILKQDQEIYRQVCLLVCSFVGLFSLTNNFLSQFLKPSPNQ